MERLTRKQKPVDLLGDGTICNYGVPNHNEFHTATAIANKLGKLEDIEEELGCPLDVLFEALKQGIYDKSGFHYDSICLIEDKIYACPLDIWEEYWDLVNYGKTWWLKEDRSE